MNGKQVSHNRKCCKEKKRKTFVTFFRIGSRLKKYSFHLSCVIFITDVSAGAIPVPAQSGFRDCNPDPALCSFKKSNGAKKKSKKNRF